MNQYRPDESEEFTLDPPGTIAVVGAGILGIEAGLYGRFLGYDLQILEMDRIGSNLLQRSDEVLPSMPNRLISTLSESALQAQRGDEGGIMPPINQGEWVTQILQPISEVDLLRGRVHVGSRVTEILQTPAEADSEEEIPADFELKFKNADGTVQTRTAEAVILAVGGQESEIQLGFTPPTPYFFSIGKCHSDDWTDDLRAGWKEITRIYAGLVGRSGLDLYRPRRL